VKLLTCYENPENSVLMLRDRVLNNTGKPAAMLSVTNDKDIFSSTKQSARLPASSQTKLLTL
jgi:hypothetical protein